ncbi:MAG TPA: LCP family protein [Anaerolineales bacterium]|nr:LCP family protein [Anaerolineales bacterium]
MSKTERLILTILTIIAIILAGLFFWFYQTKWKQPLGPSLRKSISTPFGMPPTWTPEANATNTPHSTLEPNSVANASSTPSSAVCGERDPMFILVIGSDTRADTYLYGLADVMRLVRVDFTNPKVTVLEIPRDLWVEIPDIADNLKGQDHEKLNQAYLYGNPGFGYTDDPAGGPGLLTRTLNLNFGTQIDHYIAVNMRTFTKIVDALDGIDVTLPKAVDGRTPDDMDDRLLFPQGTHHLNGTQALTLARIRINGTFSRADNQDRVLCALRNKLTSPEIIEHIPSLIQSFRGVVQTSLSPEEISQIACLSTQVQPQNIQFASFPQEYFEQGRTYDPVFKKSVFTWDVDFDILRDYIQQFNSGQWPHIIIVNHPQQESETHICQ